MDQGRIVMDPQALFDEWLATEWQLSHWDADAAKRLDEMVDNYNDWISVGGFTASDSDGESVVCLTTTGRYLTTEGWKEVLS
jgi:hypothetical protein